MHIQEVLQPGPFADAAQDAFEPVDEQHADLARGNALHEPADPGPIQRCTGISLVPEMTELEPAGGALFTDEIPAHVRLMFTGVEAMPGLPVGRHASIDRNRHDAEFLRGRTG